MQQSKLKYNGNVETHLTVYCSQGANFILVESQQRRKRRKQQQRWCEGLTNIRTYIHIAHIERNSHTIPNCNFNFNVTYTTTWETS